MFLSTTIHRIPDTPVPVGSTNRSRNMVMTSALLCLALTIYFEARGEDMEGQLAVAHVVINRTNHNNSTICKEVFKPGQFSWTKHYHVPNNEHWTNAKKVAIMSLQVKDVTKGATYFHSHKCKVSKAFYKGKVKTRHIGNHVFFATREETKND